ncbi:hypothetical protein HYH03_008775 [Edaphochlamys debaryana]|uniref:Uncharacterized protein n=1 Tax=Edaphochlamys debaryana TaxID=47281 RepID=A0A835XXV9_9CHLO|nr:hypothetical protein HYH03_008775 [Edaphochlamys debaryana]|eukprot:KAG2493112.1 hypothetical protein HYH03_008775 [Edaphochlamys debaryana]
MLLGAPALVSAKPEQLTAAAKGDLLQRCFNKHYNSTPGVFEDFLRGFNTSLQLHTVLWSEKELEPPMSVTVFVGATMERLQALEAQCRSYPGPLSAAIYVPLLQQEDGEDLTKENQDHIKKAASALKALFQRAEASPTYCALTVQLLYEAVADPPLAAIVPINTLRNAALLAATTPLVALVDVDLAPSDSLGARVLKPGSDSLREITDGCEKRAVWVLPAWETHKRLSMEEGTKVADQALKGDKAQLRQFDEESRLHWFAKLAYRKGHAPTNFSRWLDAQEPYDVAYDVNYEPWFIISRSMSPAYDVRFRGYGWNKVQQVAAVALSNFTFRVHPDAWLVHRPHAKSSGQALYRHQDGGGGRKRTEETREWKGTSAPLSRLFHRRVSALRHVTIRDMKRGTYRPAVDPQVRHCRAVLPWWKGQGPT